MVSGKRLYDSQVSKRKHLLCLILCKFLHLYSIEYGFGQFSLASFQVYRLVYDFKTYQIKLIVSQKVGCVDKKELYFSILTSFKELLLNLEQTLYKLMNLYLPSSTRPVVHVSCPHCSSGDPPHVEYMQEEMFLSCCTGPVVLEIPQARYIPCGMNLNAING